MEDRLKSPPKTSSKPLAAELAATAAGELSNSLSTDFDLHLFALSVILLFLFPVLLRISRREWQP